MASPWKLLARLVSPRRERQEQDGATDDVTSEGSAVVNPAVMPADDRSNSTDRSAGKDPKPHDQIEAILESTWHAQETGSSVQATVDTENATGVETVQVALSDDADIGAGDASKPSRTSEDTPRRRNRRGKKAEAVDVVPQPSPVVATHSDDAMSLDEEIRLLRGQMITKLQASTAKRATKENAGTLRTLNPWFLAPDRANGFVGAAPICSKLLTHTPRSVMPNKRLMVFLPFLRAGLIAKPRQTV